MVVGHWNTEKQDGRLSRDSSVQMVLLTTKDLFEVSCKHS